MSPRLHQEIPGELPKGPFRTKNATPTTKIVNYYAVVFLLRPPDLLRRGPFSERENVCNSQGKWCPHKVLRDSKSQRRTKNLPRVVNLLRRCIFSTAGSFGQVCVVLMGPMVLLHHTMWSPKTPWLEGCGLRMRRFRKSYGNSFPTGQFQNWPCWANWVLTVSQGARKGSQSQKSHG